jgi:hypothetical protein
MFELLYSVITEVFYAIIEAPKSLSEISMKEAIATLLKIMISFKKLDPKV